MPQLKRPQKKAQHREREKNNSLLRAKVITLLNDTVLPCKKEIKRAQSAHLRRILEKKEIYVTEPQCQSPAKFISRRFTHVELKTIVKNLEDCNDRQFALLMRGEVEL